jgi:hypothetical protein
VRVSGHNLKSSERFSLQETDLARIVSLEQFRLHITFNWPPKMRWLFASVIIGDSKFLFIRTENRTQFQPI